jgi:hypothetical protein
VRLSFYCGEGTFRFKESLIKGGGDVKTVVGMFENGKDVNDAITELMKQGFTKSDISVLARKEVIKETGVDVVTGAEVGAITGGVAGGVAGLLLGLGVIVVPGVGPIIAAGEFLTWVGATVLGAAAGAIGGGLIGSLTALGLPEHEAHVFAEGIKRGDILVAVRASDERAQLASDILRQFHGLDVEAQRQKLETAGWTPMEVSPESAPGPAV